MKHSYCTSQMDTLRLERVNWTRYAETLMPDFTAKWIQLLKKDKSGWNSGAHRFIKRQRPRKQTNKRNPPIKVPKPLFHPLRKFKKKYKRAFFFTVIWKELFLRRRFVPLWINEILIFVRHRQRLCTGVYRRVHSIGLDTHLYIPARHFVYKAPLWKRCGAAQFFGVFSGKIQQPAEGTK